MRCHAGLSHVALWPSRVGKHRNFTSETDKEDEEDNRMLFICWVFWSASTDLNRHCPQVNIHSCCRIWKNGEEQGRENGISLYGVSYIWMCWLAISEIPPCLLHPDRSHSISQSNLLPFLPKRWLCLWGSESQYQHSVTEVIQTDWTQVASYSNGNQHTRVQWLIFETNLSPCTW